MPEELLPKPFTQPKDGQTDLPLPEKKLPSHSDLASQGETLGGYGKSIFRNKTFIVFVIISFLVAFLIGGFVLGKNSADKHASQISPPNLGDY